MAYYLAFERNPGSHEAINIKKTIKGKKLFPNDERYECTLEEIDKFTTEYENPSSLKYMLHSERKTPWFNCRLSLVYVNGIELKITQDILYKESRQYLESPNLVVEYIANKFLDLDTDFSKELAITLSEEKTKTMLENLNQTMNNCVAYDASLEVTNAIHIAQTLIYNLDSDGKIIKPIKINYEKLHHIIAFIANYENRIKKVKTKTKTKNT